MSFSQVLVLTFVLFQHTYYCYYHYYYDYYPSQYLLLPHSCHQVAHVAGILKQVGSAGEM